MAPREQATILSRDYVAPRFSAMRSLACPEDECDFVATSVSRGRIFFKVDHTPFGHNIQSIDREDFAGLFVAEIGPLGTDTQVFSRMRDKFPDDTRWAAHFDRMERAI